MSKLTRTDLAGLFHNVPDRKLLQTVALIDRLPKRGAVDDLLAPVRPRLQRLRPPRPLSLRRVLTFPLEELLVPAVAWRPGSQRLSRDLLGEIQQSVISGLDPALVREIDRRLVGHTMRDKAMILGCGERLWPAAAEVLGASLPPSPAGGDSKGRNRRQQLEIAAELVRIGPMLAALFLALPEKPLRQVDQTQLERIGSFLQELEGKGGGALCLGAEALGQRLGDAAAMLEVLLHAGEGKTSALRLSAANDAGRRVVAELDDAAEQLRRAGRQPATALADEVVQLVGTLSALEAGPPDLPVDRAGLKQIAHKAAKAVEGHLQNVVYGEVLDGFKALASPDTDETTILAVEAAARAARKLGAAGRQLGLNGQIDLVVKSALDDYRRAIGKVGTSVDDEGRVMDQLRIVEIVFGADAAADLLKARHRGSLLESA